jgi:hypothetical protein
MHPTPTESATYAYSAMFMVFFRCGLLLPSSPEHHTVDNVQQWRTIERELRKRGGGRREYKGVTLSSRAGVSYRGITGANTLGVSSQQQYATDCG